MPPNDDNSNKLNAELRQLDNDLDRLRREYEKYFRGARNRPPNNKRNQVERQIRELEQTTFKNTSLKFRFRSLSQRYNTYKQKWNRIQRQKERGTYEPDRKKAQRRAERRQQEEQEQEEQKKESEEDADESGDELTEETDPDSAADSGSGEGIRQNEDGSFSLEMSSDDMDLEGFERELQEMDEQGEFEKYVETARLEDAELPEEGEPKNSGRQSDEATSASRNRNDDRSQDGDNEFSENAEETKRERLRSLQDELGLSGGTHASSDKDADSKSATSTDRLDEGRQKLEELRQNVESEGNPSDSGRRQPNDSSDEDSTDRSDRQTFDRQETQKVDRANPDAPSRGATPEQLQELLEKRRQQQDQQNRTTDDRGHADKRSSDRQTSNSGRRSSTEGSSESSSEDDEESHARRVYNRLIKAKKQCGESTEHLDFESVRSSMQRQTDKLRKERGAQSVDFEVVRKNGRAFLKPRFDED